MVTLRTPNDPDMGSVFIHIQYQYENRIDIDIEPPTHIDILLNIEY